MDSIVSNLLQNVPIPKMFRVRQIFSGDNIPVEQIPSEIEAKLNEKHLDRQIRPGMRIAITAGSRGISNIPLILKTLVSFVGSIINVGV